MTKTKHGQWAWLFLLSGVVSLIGAGCTGVGNSSNARRVNSSVAPGAPRLMTVADDDPAPADDGAGAGEEAPAEDPAPAEPAEPTPADYYNELVQKIKQNRREHETNIAACELVLSKVSGTPYEAKVQKLLTREKTYVAEAAYNDAVREVKSHKRDHAANIQAYQAALPKELHTRPKSTVKSLASNVI